MEEPLWWTPYPLITLTPGRVYYVDLPTLYWATHRMLHRLFSDAQQVEAAKAVAGHFFNEAEQ